MSVDVIILNECCTNIQKLNDKMFVFTLYLTIIILNQVSSTTLLQLSIRIDFYHDRNTIQFYRIQNLSNFLRVKKKKNRTKEKFVFLCVYSHLAQRHFARKTIGIMTRGPKLAVR